MTKRFLLHLRTWWQGRNRVCGEKLQRTLCGLLVLLVSGCGGGGGSTAQPSTFRTLYSFGNGSSDAMGPGGELLQHSDGNFYGITHWGGVFAGFDKLTQFTGEGTFFKITPTGEETVLHLFGSTAADGVNPQVLIQGSDGNFYGTAGGDTTNNREPVVFELTPEGVETILYTFGRASDGGSSPTGGLVQGSDGNLYGTANTFPAVAPGTLFKLTPQGVLTILHTFAGGANDGGYPFGGLLQGSDGSIYGITTSGGPGNDGAVFKITPEGVETVLHFFSGPDGGFLPGFETPYPLAGLIQGRDGNFYGTTPFGGAYNFGTVFKLTPDGVESVLYSFSGSFPGLAGPEGSIPTAGVIQGSDGNFYGTTEEGGMNGGGTLFQLTPEGVLTVLHSFTPGDHPGTKLVEGSDGNLYGATFVGGTHAGGYFFRFLLH